MIHVRIRNRVFPVYTAMEELRRDLEIEKPIQGSIIHVLGKVKKRWLIRKNGKRGYGYRLILRADDQYGANSEGLKLMYATQEWVDRCYLASYVYDINDGWYHEVLEEIYGDDDEEW